MKMKTVAFFCTALVFLAMLPLNPALAAPETHTADIAVIKDAGTYLFTIGWEKGDLGVTLIAPDGKRYSKTELGKGMAVASRQGIVIFRVENAKAGLWKAEFLEEGNGKIGAVVQRLIMPLTVTDVAAKQSKGDTIEAAFTLNGEAGKNCTYEVYLTLDGNASTGRLIGKGSAKTGKTIKASYKAQGAGSYAGYILTVSAECADGGFTDFHTASSQPFAFDNTNAPKPPEKLAAVLLSQGAEISWQPDASADGYVVAAFDGGALPYNTATLGSGAATAIVPAPEEGKFAVEVYAQRNGIAGRSSRLEIDPSMTLEKALGCSLPQENALLPGTVELHYDVQEVLAVTVSIGDKTTEKELSGKGTLLMTMNNGMNHVRITARLSDTLSVAEDRHWTADTVAPVLRIFNDPDGTTTTQEEIDISGNADDAASISVNGVSAERDKYGNFTAAVPLKDGLNTISVIIADKAGNASQYEANVTRTAWPQGFPWALAAGLPLAAIAVLFYVFSGRRRRA
jgi:hypothetical protein